MSDECRLCCLCVVLFTVHLFGVGAVEYVEVVLDEGTVRGQVENGTRAFKGIPFAADTGGSHRFLPPQPVASWTGVRDALQFGPGCPQKVGGAFNPPTHTEDCLSLNVWSPNTCKAGDSFPVAFFIHGGTFIEGWGGMFPADYVTNDTNTVVVTTNYRLGVLGFMVTDSIPGNLGILDQRAALLWVQKYIHLFCGDPKNVTIWGQSAGSMSVGFHMISPKSQGLFHGVIMQSNPLGIIFRTAKQAKRISKIACKTLKCSPSDLACLRSQSLTDIMTAQWKVYNDLPALMLSTFPMLAEGFLSWTPVVDGVELPSQILPAFSSGAFARVPTIVGTNSNEAYIFLSSTLSKPLPGWLADAFLMVAFGVTNLTQGYDVVKAYNIKALDKDARPAVMRAFSDSLFRCPIRKLITLMRNHNVPAWIYHFNHVYTYFDDLSHMFEAGCSTRTCHGMELPMVFHAWDKFRATPQEVALSEMFVRFWTNLAHSGSPEAATLPPWPVYNPTSEVNIVLQTPEVTLEQDGGLCDMWDSFGYEF